MCVFRFLPSFSSKQSLVQRMAQHPSRSLCLFKPLCVISAALTTLWRYMGEREIEDGFLLGFLPQHTLTYNLIYFE